jgi:hypothetical protein
MREGGGIPQRAFVFAIRALFLPAGRDIGEGNREKRHHGAEIGFREARVKDKIGK